jgi:hypothetical protein
MTKVVSAELEEGEEELDDDEGDDMCSGVGDLDGLVQKDNIAENNIDEEEEDDEHITEEEFIAMLQQVENSDIETLRRIAELADDNSMI